MTIGLDLVFRKLVSHQTRGVRAGHDALVARENSTHDGQLRSVVRDEDQLGEREEGYGVELANRPVIWGTIERRFFSNLPRCPPGGARGDVGQVFESPIRDNSPWTIGPITLYGVQVKDFPTVVRFVTILAGSFCRVILLRTIIVYLSLTGDP